jgi:hypothetical protein
MHLSQPPESKALRRVQPPVACRCTSLERLRVNAKHYEAVAGGFAADDGNCPYEPPIHFKACFRGRGSTPGERCAHLQRQVASLSGGPHFLAPSSWPSCACLEALSLMLFALSPQHLLLPYFRAAVQTASLRSLRVHVRYPSVREVQADTLRLHLRSVSSLRGLTDLQLSCALPPLTASALEAVSSLEDLVTLDLGSLELTPDLCK